MKSKHKCSLLQDSISHLPKLLPNDSLVAKLSRRVNKSFLVSLNHPEVLTYLKSSTAVEKESKRQVDSKYFIIHPLSEFRKYWNIIIFVAIFVHQLLTAFSVGFFMDLSGSTVYTLFAIDGFMCFLLCIEIIISFRSGYIVKETNEIILNPKTIARKYIIHFIPDVITSVPYILIITSLHFEENNSLITESTVVFMLILFILCLYRFNQFHKYCLSIPIMLNWSEKTLIIFTVCLRTFYLWHWTSSIRKLILFYCEQTKTKTNEWEMPREISKFHVRRLDFAFDFDYEDTIEEVIQSDALLFESVSSNYTILNKYTRSLMITLKLALQSGYGNETSDSSVNMLMTSFILFAGWIYCTYILILISNIIIASSVSKNKYQEIMNEIDVFAESKRLSSQLQDKIRIYMERKFQKRYFNEQAINMYVETTAACLQKEIMMHSCSGLVSKVSLFKDLPKSLLENIISCVKFEIYFPDEIIIEANTIGDSMYFIAYGTAVVISTTGQRIQILQDGSHFGEISLLIKGQKRTATVKTLETCEVYKLSQKDFRKVIEPHQDIMKIMEEIAKERLRRMYQQETGSSFERKKSTSSK
ncbi:potassium/sodium hyperpolarization-activated cyclic nucleotide-gated channel 2-like [Chironomus tepperi]|uniref:potassium/sodium hyperpolarization-activated cyclic nucleotide-gated channel 2-like n=1 Tax=Chironomus tepperi TaxID=113505 RepID=UPI00391F7FA9